ncbi:MAG: indole-3-glycerol phosphate synthase TrpC [bacterium]
MTILDDIMARKHNEVAVSKVTRPLARVESDAKTASPPRGFYQRLQHKQQTGFALIAEVKKASPSKGLIRADFEPASIAKAYQAGGAACLSVLTDEVGFQGCTDYLIEARQACTLPILRKDFIIDPYQVIEARAMGADCILLIMACLSNAQAAELESAAHELGMDVLLETHNAHEMERAIALNSPLIGINNRNLATFETSVTLSEELSRHCPADRLLISESGLSCHADLTHLARFGIKSFLIGEALMRQENIELATQNLLAP